MARRLDELDYYALLGVSPSASVDAIKDAFRNFARRYHPDRHAGDEAAVAKMTRIYRRGTEAYRVLTHAEQRRAYDQQLAAGALRLDPAQVKSTMRPSVAPGQVEVRDARARPFVQKGEQALRLRDYKQAKLHFQVALNYEPDNPVLQQKLGAIELLLKPG